MIPFLFAVARTEHFHFLGSVEESELVDKGLSGEFCAMKFPVTSKSRDLYLNFTGSNAPPSDMCKISIVRHGLTQKKSSSAFLSIAR